MGTGKQGEKRQGHAVTAKHRRLTGKTPSTEFITVPIWWWCGWFLFQLYGAEVNDSNSSTGENYVFS
jgi:hypothetical protein